PFVKVEQALLFVVLVLVHFADLNQLAHDFRVKAGAFGLGIDFLDIFAEHAFFVLKPLDTLDKGFELLARDAPEIRHFPLIPFAMPPPGGGADDTGALAGDQCFCAAAKAAFCSALASFWYFPRHSS